MQEVINSKNERSFVISVGVGMSTIARIFSGSGHRPPDSKINLRYLIEKFTLIKSQMETIFFYLFKQSFYTALEFFHRPTDNEDIV